MDKTHSFGYWVRRRRKALDLSQRELAERAACSLSAIKKIEQDTRRPSRQMAEVLADCLTIPIVEREQFLRSARGLAPVDEMPLASKPLGSVAERADKMQPAVTGNLPAAVTPIFGRNIELNHLFAHISAADIRLITLIGPGGVGKSRLMLEVARRAQASFPDGAWIVSLTGVDDPEYLSTAIAVALGLNFAGPLDPEQQVIRQLRGRHLLLLLDNFEQLLPEGVGLVSSLIQSLPHLTVLVTSRVRLRLQAEVTVPVGGLRPEPARALFVERAQRTGADLASDQAADNSAAIDGVCRLVGGLPLAIELAAAWARLLPPAEILADLEHSFELLAGDLHDLPERHRNMQAVFVASWNRLPPDAQNVLAGMSVFAGSFSRDAAESICGATLSQLAMLHDHSLIERDKERFRLHELIRQLAAEKAANNPEEQAAAKARHAAYYIDFLGRLSRLFMSPGDQVSDWQRSIEREMDNIHAAWRWAITSDQPQRLLPTTLALSNYLDIRGQAAALNFLGLLNLLQGRPDQARDFLSESVAWWSQQAGLTYGKVRSLVHLGLAHHALGNYERAQSIQEEALRQAQEIQDYGFTPLSRCNLAFHHYAQGELELAETGFRTALAEAKRLDLLNFVWHSILGLGMAAVALGQSVRAVTLLTLGLGRPGGHLVFLLGEPQRVLAELRAALSPAKFTAAEAQARAMELADLMAWL